MWHQIRGPPGTSALLNRRTAQTLCLNERTAAGRSRFVAVSRCDDGTGKPPVDAGVVGVAVIVTTTNPRVVRNDDRPVLLADQTKHRLIVAMSVKFRMGFFGGPSIVSSANWSIGEEFVVFDDGLIETVDDDSRTVSDAKNQHATDQLPIAIPSRTRRYAKVPHDPGIGPLVFGQRHL